MGRALLLICSGLVLLFGLIEVNIQSRQKEMIGRGAISANEAQARDMANGAIDLAMQKLESNPGWRNGYQPWSVSMDYGTATVQIIDYTTDTSLTYRQLKLIGISILNTDTAEVVTKIQETGGLPKVPSAMGFYSDTLNFQANGSSFVINGNDTKIDGTSGYGTDLPGISVPGQNAYNTIYNSLNSNQQNKITGSTGTIPSIDVNSNISYTSLQNSVTDYTNNADTTYYAGNYSGTQFGSATNPQITVVDGNIKVSGNSGGYGVMIVENASQLNFTGTFTYNGIIIMEGGMFQSSGNIYLNGSLQFGSTTTTQFSGASISGNVNINYSTQAFQKVEAGMPQKLGIRYYKLDTYE